MQHTLGNGQRVTGLGPLDDHDLVAAIASVHARRPPAELGRDEVRDADELLGRMISQITLPLVIDSTEVPVIERALQRSPGKCVVNSINFEDGEGKARKILDLCKTYGAAVVALTIDERGMAKTRAEKLAVAKRLHTLVVGEYGMDPGDLILDPLTFTLGSGDEEFRGSAVETLEPISEK